MKTLWLIGGLGLGAGLMYLWDPEQGEWRRDRVRAQWAAYGHQTEDLLDSATRALGQPARDLLAKTRVPRLQWGLGERRMTQAEQRGMTTGLFLLGCMGLGAALTALLEPSGGPSRRALVCDTVRAYWHKTEYILRRAAGDGQQHTHGPSLDDEYVAQTE
jgi:hypothetical protein